MIRIDHTAYPVGRKPNVQLNNTIKEGGLWYSEGQKSVLEQAIKLTSPKSLKEQKRDEIKMLCYKFWIVLVAIAILSSLMNWGVL
jgi:hypothetical protein